MNQHELLPASQVANLLGITPQALTDLRFRAFGPPYFQPSPKGGRGMQTRYRRADVHTYAQARQSGMTVRDATIWTAHEAHRLTCETIAARSGSDPKFAAAQRRMADLQLASALQKVGCMNPQVEIRRIGCALAGLPCPGAAA